MVLSAGKIRSYAGEDKLQRNQTAILVDTVFFCYWHETDMPTALRDVRSQGQSGKHMLAWSFSGFDPTGHSTLG
jgi:hypothetical protein